MFRVQVSLSFSFLSSYVLCVVFFFFQAEDGIRDRTVTGVQTCALPIFVGGWIVFMTSRFVFTSEELKAELATGAPEAVNAVVFRLSACAIWSGLSHQYWPKPASSWRSPKWSEGFTCPPNIHPSSLLLISLKVHSSACTF